MFFPRRPSIKWTIEYVDTEHSPWLTYAFISLSSESTFYFFSTNALVTAFIQLIPFLIQYRLQTWLQVRFSSFTLNSDINVEFIFCCTVIEKHKHVLKKTENADKDLAQNEWAAISEILKVQMLECIKQYTNRKLKCTENKWES